MLDIGEELRAQSSKNEVSTESDVGELVCSNIPTEAASVESAEKTSLPKAKVLKSKEGSVLGGNEYVEVVNGDVA